MPPATWYSVGLPCRIAAGKGKGGTAVAPAAGEGRLAGRRPALAQASVDASAAAAYAQTKAAVCAVRGISFIPMVAETTGTWDKRAARILKLIAAAAAAREVEDRSAMTAIMFQELSVCIWGFRVCATLRRRAELHASTRAEPVRSTAVMLEPPAV